MNDLDSVYHYYKKLIDLRKDNDVLIYGDYELILPNHDQIFAYLRKLGNEKYLVLTNLLGHDVSVILPVDLVGKWAALCLSNYAVEDSETLGEMTFHPYEARVYKLE
jgi:glycosidase